MEIRALIDDDREWARAVLIERWITPRIVTRGRVHEADTLPGFIAIEDGARKGLWTYRAQRGDCSEPRWSGSVQVGKADW